MSSDNAVLFQLISVFIRDTVCVAGSLKIKDILWESCRGCLWCSLCRNRCRDYLLSRGNLIKRYNDSATWHFRVYKKTRNQAATSRRKIQGANWRHISRQKNKFFRQRNRSQEVVAMNQTIFLARMFRKTIWHPPPTIWQNFPLWYEYCQQERCKRTNKPLH